MSVEAFGHINPNQTVETSQKYDQPLYTPDATTLPEQESYDYSNVRYLSSADTMEHESALLAALQTEATALAEQIQQADLALARIEIDFLDVKEQISDLGRPGVPQMDKQRELEQAYEVAVANKASLVALHSAKTEKINNILTNQDRRERSMSEDYKPPYYDT